MSRQGSLSISASKVNTGEQTRDKRDIVHDSIPSNAKKMEGDKLTLKRKLIRWMEDNRGLILTFIGLPASFIFDLIMQVKLSKV